MATQVQRFNDNAIWPNFRLFLIKTTFFLCQKSLCNLIVMIKHLCSNFRGSEDEMCALSCPQVQRFKDKAIWPNYRLFLIKTTFLRLGTLMVSLFRITHLLYSESHVWYALHWLFPARIQHLVGQRYKGNAISSNYLMIHYFPPPQHPRKCTGVLRSSETPSP